MGRKPAMSSNTVFCSRQSRKLGQATEAFSYCGCRSQSCIRPSASEYGSGFSKTPLIMLKIEVVAPIPTARVRTATNVNPSRLRIIRNAKRTSCPDPRRKFSERTFLSRCCETRLQ